MIQRRPAFPLDGDVFYSEARMKLPTGLFDQRVVIAGIRFEQVGGKCGFRGAHGPDVQIVNTFDTGQA